MMSPHGKEKLSASLEDYLEAIYNLSQRETVARSKDIADALGVSRASVTGALRTLSEKQFVNYKPYEYITLTDKGEQLAVRIARRHAILNQFFADVLGVDADLAHEAACRAEHSLGSEITPRLVAFVDFITRTRDAEDNIAQQFQQHWESVNDD